MKKLASILTAAMSLVFLTSCSPGRQSNTNVPETSLQSSTSKTESTISSAAKEMEPKKTHVPAGPALKNIDDEYFCNVIDYKTLIDNIDDYIMEPIIVSGTVKRAEAAKVLIKDGFMVLLEDQEGNSFLAEIPTDKKISAGNKITVKGTIMKAFEGHIDLMGVAFEFN